jgi:TPP-dependent pyruvate/acetoin dehydrogenase alpha subunit
MSRTNVGGGEVKKKTAAGTVAENPLVPNAVLRQMYQKMVEMRLLEAQARRLGQRPKAGKRIRWTPGHEACRVSLAQGLSAGDVVMDSRPGGLMDHLLGGKLADVAGGIKALGRRDKGSKVAGAVERGSKRLLPFIAPAEERLLAGLGAALLLRQIGRTDGVVMYAEHKEASNDSWRKAFTVAAAQELPVIFVVLPSPNPKSKDQGKAGVSGIAHRCGVPGIHVDAGDVIALYRVVQESWMKIRGGGGPVLIEGVPFHVQGEKRPAAADPIAQLGEYLLSRRVCTQAWLVAKEKTFRGRLAAAWRV